MKNLIVGALALTSSLNAFAACDTEKAEYERFKQICADYTAASQAGFTGGTILGAIFAVPTFGLSLAAGGLLGGPPGLIAKNSCRIRDEKLHNLNLCEDAVVNAAKANKNAMKAELDRQKERKAEIKAINKEYDKKRNQAEKEFQAGVNAVIEDLVKEGYDVEAEETVELITESRRDLEKALADELDAIEKARRKALSKI